MDYGVYRDDALLTAVALTQPPPACSLTLGCVSPPQDLAHLGVVGEYRDTGQHHLGRSLLSHAHHHVLHLLVDTYWGWVVETEPGSGDHCLRSLTAPTLCPAKAGRGWRYRNKDGKYVKFPALVARCSTHSFISPDKDMMRTDAPSNENVFIFNFFK